MGYFATNYVAFLGFTILVWDQMLTFGDEVEFIWKSRKTLISYLFLLNRYMTPLGFIVCLYAYLSPSFTNLECHHFVVYEGAMIGASVYVAEFMMLRRVLALYQDSRIVPIVGSALLATCLGTTLVLLYNGYPVPHSLAVHTCTEINRDDPQGIASATVWLMVVSNSYIAGCVLARTLPLSSYRDVGAITRALIVDGLIYYFAMFILCVLQGILMIVAPDYLKNIFAQSKLHMTVALTSRMTLNLHREHRKSTRKGTRHWEDATSVFPTIELASHPI